MQMQAFLRVTAKCSVCVCVDSSNDLFFCYRPLCSTAGQITTDCLAQAPNWPGQSTQAKATNTYAWRNTHFQATVPPADVIDMRQVCDAECPSLCIDQIRLSTN